MRWKIYSIRGNFADPTAVDLASVAVAFWFSLTDSH
jgi:hypothetical protein